MSSLALLCRGRRQPRSLPRRRRWRSCRGNIRQGRKAAEEVRACRGVHVEDPRVVLSRLDPVPPSRGVLRFPECLDI